jgi:peptidoglycan/xylan/chitin deacetylase (PgdA/CDA1 family)
MKGFRPDRLLTLYLALPLVQVPRQAKFGIPILMYHSIADELEAGVRGYYRTATSPKTFASHLKFLRDNGYQTCSLAEAARLLGTDNKKATKIAVITFDDGYSNVYRHAFPVLNEYGFTATIFVPTNYIADNPLQFRGRDCLTWPEIRELKKYGILFGSHTATHPQLRDLEPWAVWEELTKSKAILEEKLGCSIDSFAYPFAFPEEDATFVEMLRKAMIDAGYLYGVSTRIGVARRPEDRYFLPRLPMNSLDDVRFFDAKLKGAYDWLHPLQLASKIMKARVAGPR